ncbi:acylphosphatase [Lysobacter sp. N42]|uniref:acylphosphatase n=1 Tax=Lysobacter sp. N42 TaxID=2545719 RepID=UPI00104C1D88|nr:acylphosphatase [Lysobacter sp. N42]TCZ83422.1 acylphosphatase [Lysobacter sp. N42]
MTAARFLVSGRVQGVAFRAHARAEALRLGLRGHVRNLADGRVDVLAAGDDGALEAFAAWLAKGPPLARVDGIERLPTSDDAVGAGFVIG